MELENLKAKRKMLQSMVKVKELEIEKLDKQIEAIENGPVSVEDILDKYLSIIPNQHFNSEFRDALHSFGTECEQNDRKRTQPLIDFANEISGKLNNYWLPKLEEALKTLEENEV